MSASRNSRLRPRTYDRATRRRGDAATLHHASVVHHPSSVDAVCIGCGCTDSRACVDQISGEPCSWIKVDRQFMIGVCTSCEHKVDEFYAQLLEKMKA